MDQRGSLLGIGLGSSILSLACASAFAAIPPADNVPRPPAVTPGASFAEPTVIVTDPRSKSIRIEVPASAVAAGDDARTLYRKLVRTSAAKQSATVAVAENGRIFFRHAGEESTLARAPQPEPVAEPLVLKRAEAISKSPQPGPESRRRTERAAIAQPPRRTKVPAPVPPLGLDDIAPTLPLVDETEPEAPSLFAASREQLGTCSAGPFGSQNAAPAPAASSHGAQVFVRETHLDLATCSEPEILEVAPMQISGVVSLVSLDEAGEWLVSNPRR